MRKNIGKYNLTAIMMILAISFLIPFVASAKNTDVGNGSDTSGDSNTELGTAVQVKLQGQNLEKCQNREMAINNIMTRTGDRGQKQINVIESIQQKVQSFYSEKNISIDNYESLTSNIEAKKQVAITAMNQVQTMKGTFSCGTDNPKGVATQFKSQASIQLGAIKEYKESVHELVVAIKTNLSTSALITEEN